MGRNTSFWEFVNRTGGTDQVAKKVSKNHQDPSIVKANEYYDNLTGKLKKGKQVIGVVNKFPLGPELEFLADIPIDIALGYSSFGKDITNIGIDIGNAVGGETYDEYKNRLNKIKISEKKPVFSPPHPAVPQQGTSSFVYDKKGGEIM